MGSVVLLALHPCVRPTLPRATRHHLVSISPRPSLPATAPCCETKPDEEAVQIVIALKLDAGKALIHVTHCRSAYFEPRRPPHTADLRAVDLRILSMLGDI